MLIKYLVLCSTLLSITLGADTVQTTNGKCSPNIINSKGNITINCEDKNIAPFFFLDLSCHAYYYKNSDPEESINNFYDFLKKNDGKMVVVEYLFSPPAFCSSIEGLPKKNILKRFNNFDSSYSSPLEAFTYRNIKDDLFRFDIHPKDTHDSTDSATLSNDCGHACARWILIGSVSTTYLSSDSSNVAIIDIGPRSLKFSDRYLNTMDEITKLRHKLSTAMSFSFEPLPN